MRHILRVDINIQLLETITEVDADELTIVQWFGEGQIWKASKWRKFVVEAVGVASEMDLPNPSPLIYKDNHL
jgi:hypothetical protein